MGKIDRSSSNLYPFPKGAYLRNKVYVYVNTSSKYVRAEQRKGEGTRGYTDHSSLCIGVLEDPNASEKKFFANERYRAMMGSKDLPEPPLFADSLPVGLFCMIQTIADECGLAEDLAEAFGEDTARQILDCSHYMLSRESAVMQHYPAWAREHILFSDKIASDTALGKFLKSDITIPRIKRFKDLWALRNTPGDRVKLYLCYDSTNTNSQAEGVFIVQKGHAKDDPSLEQVNTDYVVRQEDGLPFTYLHSPGSVPDIAQAQEMIKFMTRIKDLSKKDVSLVLICDRGYISEKNLRQMDDAKIGYILMLRTSFGLYGTLSDAAIEEVKSYKNEIITPEGDEMYGITVPVKIYNNGPECFAHVYWSAERYESKRREVAHKIQVAREKVEAFISESKGKSFLLKDLKWIPSYFKLKLEPGEPLIRVRKKRGKGGGAITEQLETVRIVGYSDDEVEINKTYQKAGIMILVSSDQITAQECLDEYSKRDCVEKTFRALKSHLGMDKIGVSSEEAMHGKGLIWFVASILHTYIFIRTKKLRVTNRKWYTVPAIVREMENIKADRDLTLGVRERRYKLTKRQNRILNCWNLDQSSIDAVIKDLDV